MVNSIIVTLITPHNIEICDVELPCNMVIEDIKDQLKHLNYIESMGGDFSLMYEGRMLDESTTFSENNVWDGAYLTVR